MFNVVTFLPVPGPVSNLTLFTDKNSLTAQWSSLVAEYSSFTVELQLKGKKVEVRQEVLDPSVRFSGLESGANYTVSVFMVTGDVLGPSVEAYIHTSESPAPPHYNLSVTCCLDLSAGVFMVIMMQYQWY